MNYTSGIAEGKKCHVCMHMTLKVQNVQVLNKLVTFVIVLQQEKATLKFMLN